MPPGQNHIFNEETNNAKVYFEIMIRLKLSFLTKKYVGEVAHFTKKHPHKRYSDLNFQIS